jgi:hypothetical protein
MEAAVMIAFAMYLLEQGASEVHVHPNGGHLKRYDMSACLKTGGFALMHAHQGVYRRGQHPFAVSCNPVSEM